MTKECLLAEKSSETGPQKMRVLGRRAEFVFFLLLVAGLAFFSTLKVGFVLVADPVFLCIFKGWVRDLLP
jgi:hypothetical protein